MKACIFSASAGTLRKKPGFGGRDIQVLPLADLRRTLAGLPHDTLVYVDVAGMAAKELTRVLGHLRGNPTVGFGVVDLAGAVDDVAGLFHAGAVDYIGKRLGGDGLASKRLKSVAVYAASRAGDGGGDGAEAETAAPTEDGWAEIVEGGEHKFAFLFIDVDDAEEMKKRYEPGRLATAMDTFRAFIEREASAHGGRLWMWTQFGGLVLFPLRGSICGAALCGFRVLLSRIFYDVEASLLPGRISFRMALSHGTTVYKAKETGKLVSDAINSIYHLGRKFARPGQFVLTAEALGGAPEALRGYCQPAGTFEGRRIMLLTEPPGGR
ncbi:MAG TPA: hypothetical protein VHE79_00765 [Spirochaetia bacterium]